MVVPAMLETLEEADQKPRGLISPTIAYSFNTVRAKNTTKFRRSSVSFVSLGCPKALVDSERIITRLRAEGYALTREHKGSTSSSSTPAASSTAPKRIA